MTDREKFMKDSRADSLKSFSTGIKLTVEKMRMERNCTGVFLKI